MYLRLLVVAGSAAFLNLALSATWQFGGPIAPGTSCRSPFTVAESVCGRNCLWNMSAPSRSGSRATPIGRRICPRTLILTTEQGCVAAHVLTVRQGEAWQ